MAIDFRTLMLFFLYSLVVGVGIGVFYDAFRIIRIILPKAYIIIFIEDILFCLSTGIILCIFIFNAGYGIIRGYAVVGTGIGFTVYYLTIGKIVYRLSEAIINLIKKVILFLAKTISLPIISFSKFLYRIILSVIKKIQQGNILKKVVFEAKSGFHLLK